MDRMKKVDTQEVSTLNKLWNATTKFITFLTSVATLVKLITELM